MVTVHQFPIFHDNYTYLVIDDQTNLAFAVDPGDSTPIINFLQQNPAIKLTHILNTHHHFDHINGNESLKNTSQATIFAPVDPRIASDQTVTESDHILIGHTLITVLETPGHTKSHICYYLAKQRLLFCGDTLFSLGCGRCFEEKPTVLWNSLKKIKNLPDDTLIYCAHEYTLANARFTQSLHKDNTDLNHYINEHQLKRDNQQPTIPVSLGREKKFNLFLQADHHKLMQKIFPCQPDLQASQYFVTLRSLKDNF